jgi:threonine/homoserine/homoserine lactone efflux protein
MLAFTAVSLLIIAIPGPGVVFVVGRARERDVGEQRVAFSIVRIAFGFVFHPVPGATPNSPYSGFTAYSRPS